MRSKKWKEGMFLGVALLFMVLGSGIYEAKADPNFPIPPLCPNVEIPDGWLRMDLVPVDPDLGDEVDATADFSEGLLGTFELLDNDSVVGGLEWLYTEVGDEGFPFTDPNDTFFCEDGTADACVGGQTVVWWSQKAGRRTWIHFTNTALPETQAFEIGTGLPPGCTLGDLGCAPLNLSVHVQVLAEGCQEILNFCDSYTPLDSHVYDLGNLFTNTGIKVPESSLQDMEGTFIITPVVACDVDNRAIDFQYLYGSMRMIDSSNSPEDFDYGVNMWVRTADASTCVCDVDDIKCGSALADFGGVADILGCGQESLDCTSEGCEFNPNTPTQLQQNFSTFVAGDLSSEAARSDLVLLNFRDEYFFFQPILGYSPLAAQTLYFPDEFDTVEVSVSCPQQQICWGRFGLQDVGDPFPPSTEPLPSPTPTPTPTPIPSPTATPTASPTPTPPGTPTPTPTVTQQFGQGGGNCSTIAGAPVQLGTAMANILIPLVPAFAIGYRLVRRRRKNQK